MKIRVIYNLSDAIDKTSDVQRQKSCGFLLGALSLFQKQNGKSYPGSTYRFG
ncbi:hypothetical protein [Myroides indicus]|uniref:hypothetical protein n=1 Tax=Myroides indicus TaxID=1323422 RepID=UPI001414DACF|nr:hypothetical protein [Myroides indicus]